MNIITGMISPETNCAPKLALKSSSFSCGEDLLDLALAAEHLDQRVAGEGLLDVRVERPVCRHCAMNRPCERFMIWPVTSIESGTVTSATSASSGEIDEHHRQHADDGQQRDEQLAHRLLQGLADVVDVVGDPRQQLAARLPVEVAQRQPVELVLDVVAHPAHGALHDAVEQVALQPRQQRRGDVDAEHEQQHVRRRAPKSTPCPGTTSIRGEHVGEAVRRRRRAAPATASALRGARRQLAAEQAGEDQVGGVAEDLRPDHGERRR